MMTLLFPFFNREVPNAPIYTFHPPYPISDDLLPYIHRRKAETAVQRVTSYKGEKIEIQECFIFTWTMMSCACKNLKWTKVDLWATEAQVRAYKHTVTPPGSQNHLRGTTSSTWDRVPSVLSTHERCCHLLWHSNSWVLIVRNCLNYQKGICT